MTLRRWVAVVAGVGLLWVAGWLVGGPVGQFERAAGLMGVSGEFKADKCLIPSYQDGPPPADCRGVFRPDGGGTTNERARIWSGAPVGRGVQAVCEGDECHVVSAAEVARTLTLIALALLPGAVGLLLVGLGLGEAGERVIVATGVAGALLVTLSAIAGVSWFLFAVTGL